MRATMVLLAVVAAGAPSLGAAPARAAGATHAPTHLGALATPDATMLSAGERPAVSVGCDGIVVVVDRGTLPAVPLETSPDAPAVTPGTTTPGGRVACATVHDGDVENGLDVLDRAGVRVEGTARWGAAFVCRVDGRPGADEPIQLPDGATVRESCAQTPSIQAHWSVWVARDGGTWEYSSVGASELELEAGDALGLVFTGGQTTGPALRADDARRAEHGPGWARPATPGSPTTEKNASDTAAAASGPGALAAVALGLVATIGVVAVLRLRRAP